MTITLRSGQLQVTPKLPVEAFIHQRAGTAVPLDDALRRPEGLPPLPQCVVNGDRVALLLDPEVPNLVDVTTQVWEQLQLAEGDLDVTLLLPRDESGGDWQSLIESLPFHLRQQAAIQIHDPDDNQQCRYLASSASGERIYLSHHIVDADLIVSVALVGHDPVTQIRDAGSLLYPALADQDAVERYQRKRVDSLRDGFSRTSRELVDEISWLVGTQFAVQVVPGNDGSPSFVCCGTVEESFKLAEAEYQSLWTVDEAPGVDLALLSIAAEPSGFAWKQFGAALQAVSPLVEDGGRIVVVADLPAETGSSLGLLQRTSDAGSLIQPLQTSSAVDVPETIQLIDAVSRYRVYLLSRLDAEFVEDLGLLPLSSESEIDRLLDSSRAVAVYPNAQHLSVSARFEIANT